MKTITEIQQKTIQFLQKTLIQIRPDLPENFPTEDHFKEVWGLDSLDLVEYVARIEQEYRLEIPDEDLEKLGSIDQIMEYLEKKEVI